MSRPLTQLTDLQCCSQARPREARSPLYPGRRHSDGATRHWTWCHRQYALVGRDSSSGASHARQDSRRCAAPKGTDRSSNPPRPRRAWRTAVPGRRDCCRSRRSPGSLGVTASVRTSGVAYTASSCRSPRRRGRTARLACAGRTTAWPCQTPRRWLRLCCAAPTRPSRTRASSPHPPARSGCRCARAWTCAHPYPYRSRCCARHRCTSRPSTRAASHGTRRARCRAGARPR
mmetsp:Transcript_25986/g.67178  ORF Transcript_25986/g.67178 Transcript_25986/m.67178 type:complete len:231 (-) Transcript_25986:87-779(-)